MTSSDFRWRRSGPATRWITEAVEVATSIGAQEARGRANRDDDGLVL